MAPGLRARSGKRSAALFHAAQRRRGFALLAHRHPLEFLGQALPVTRPLLRAFSERSSIPQHCEIHLTMSNGAKTARKPSAPQPSQQASSAKNLLGLMPYLARYRPAIALGMLALALTSVIGNVIPLATGVMTDILAGSPRPFETNIHAQALAGGWLSRVVPFYDPHSRHALGIYCLVLVVCILLKGAMSFITRWVLIGVSRDIEFDLRADLLDRLLLLEPEFYVRNRTGELMSRATND